MTINTLLIEAADALQAMVDELVQAHTVPGTATLDSADVVLKVESEQDLVNRLREAALVVGNPAEISQKTAETRMDAGFEGGGQQTPAAHKPQPVAWPDCWVVVKDGQIIAACDAPGHYDGIEAVRYTPPAAPVHGPVASNQDESDRVLALRTLEYANGAKAGWNLAIDADQAGLARIMDSIPEAVRILKTTPPAAQPAVPAALSYAHQKAIAEAECAGAAETYFTARHNMLDTLQNRRLFEAGFDRGFWRGIARTTPPAAQPAPCNPAQDGVCDALGCQCDTPPAQPAVPLTDEQITALVKKHGFIVHTDAWGRTEYCCNASRLKDFARAIEALLREKNAAQPAAPEAPQGIGGALVAIKTLLSRDPCAHANTAIAMIDEALKLASKTPAQPAAPTIPPVLVRDAAKALGCTVLDVCRVLVQLGRPPRSTNMAISGEELEALAGVLRPAAPAIPSGWTLTLDGQHFKLTSPEARWWDFGPNTDGPDRLVWEFLSAMRDGVPAQKGEQP